jgi:hypothetical protein
MSDRATSTSSAGDRARMVPALPPLGFFKNRHKGQRCFLVGNGPSLSHLDLRKLAGELAFTVNRGYLASRFGLPQTPYYLITDPLTYGPYALEVRRAAVGTRFYRADVCDLPEYRDAPDREPAIRVPFHRAPTMDEGYFAEDATTGVFRGFTVILDAAQLAFMMGCHEVYIIGCDLDYQQTDTHVYGTGPIEQQRINVMPIAKVLEAMAVAARVFQRHGRTFANAGVGGRLDVIPRVDYRTLF